MRLLYILASAKAKILSVRAERHRREVKYALYMFMCDEGGHEQ